MASKNNQFVQQAQTFLRGLSMGQRMVLGASVVLVGGTIWLFVTLFDRGGYKPVYSGLSPAEAQTISQKLAAENIQAQVSPDGATLSVPAAQVDRVRLELAAKGLPQTGRQGFELFDKPNWAGSDFSEKVNYQRALEGELERTISSISEIESCRVHLVLPRESLFTEREREAKAAVLLKLRGRRPSDDTLNGITYLVASAVDNLQPENVTIVDSSGKVPLISHRGAGGGFGSATEQENLLTQKLIATLAPVVGPEHIRATVTIEYDTASAESTQEAYDPKGSVVLTSQVQSDPALAGAGAAEGVPGTTSNAPQAASQSDPANPANTGVAAAAEAAKSDAPGAEPLGMLSDNKTFAVSKLVRHVVQPAGNVRRIYASLLLDDAVETKGENGHKSETRRKRTPDELKQIQDLAMASIGIDATRGDQLTVENISFTSPGAESPAPPTLVQRAAPILNQFSDAIRYIALFMLFGLIYLLVLRPVKKQIVTSFKQLPARVGPRADSSVLAGPAPQAVAAVPTLNAALPPRLTQELELTEDSPEARRVAALQNTLVERIAKEPQEAGRLIQDWVQQ